LFDLGGGARHVVDQVLDGGQRLVDLLTAIASGLVGTFGGIGRAHRVVGHFFDCCGHLVDGGGGLVDFRALLVQAAAGVFGDGVQLFRGRGQLVGGGGDLADGVAQAVLHAAQGAQQQSRFVTADDTDVLGQVAGGHALGHSHCIGQRHHDAAREHRGNGGQCKHDDHQ